MLQLSYLCNTLQVLGQIHLLVLLKMRQVNLAQFEFSLLCNLKRTCNIEVDQTIGLWTRPESMIFLVVVRPQSMGS